MGLILTYLTLIKRMSLHQKSQNLSAERDSFLWQLVQFSEYSIPVNGTFLKSTLFEHSKQEASN